MWQFFDSDEHATAKPVRDAIGYIKELALHNGISVVTARPEIYEKQTKKWLEQHASEIMNYMHFTNGYGGGVKREKGEVCKELGIDVFVEDAPVHIGSLSGHVSKVFLFDMPWNQDFELPSNAERVHSWKELRDKLL